MPGRSNTPAQGNAKSAQSSPAATIRPTAYGQPPKTRGLVTRQRLLETVAEMIEEMPYHELRVTEIARRSGNSGATFYHYFGDVATAVREIFGEHAQGFSDVIDSALSLTSDRQMNWEAATALAGGFLQFWQLHRGLLRMVNTATEEDDIRFFRLRDRVLTSITKAPTNSVPSGRRGHEIDAIATAGALVMMLTHVTARSGRYERSGYSVEVLTGCHGPHPDLVVDSRRYDRRARSSVERWQSKWWVVVPCQPSQLVNCPRF